MRVTVDGEIEVEALLDPVFTQKFVAQESIQLRTGNAAGVVLTLNGEQLPPLGETAEAFRYLDQGHARGKVVITVEPKAK